MLFYFLSKSSPKTQQAGRADALRNVLRTLAPRKQIGKGDRGGRGRSDCHVRGVVKLPFVINPLTVQKGSEHCECFIGSAPPGSGVDSDHLHFMAILPADTHTEGEAARGLFGER